MIEELRQRHPDKLAPLERIFSHIRPGNRIFVGTACGEPQFLTRSLADYLSNNPGNLCDAELMQIWTLGLSRLAEEPLRGRIRFNTFYIGDSLKEAVNSCEADYQPAFLYQVPALFRRGLVPVDVALIQVSLPDANDMVSLGISVDIARAAVEAADIVVAQINPRMPRIPGATFIPLADIDFIVFHDEPLLEYRGSVPRKTKTQIGRHLARIVEDGATLQIGYGKLPNAVLGGLKGKRHLGIHSELFTDGMVSLMLNGVVDNSNKTADRGKSVASFCMGSRKTYGFLDDNPSVRFMPIDATNDPLRIASQERMTAINSALQLDLTGQATAESIGSTLVSGVGGQADFIRGSQLSSRGRSILVLPSTALGGRVSRIVPALDAGAGVTVTRADVQYVITEYGVAYLAGKSVRERTMALIGVAHPKFRGDLLDEAKKRNLVYQDQALVPGHRGQHPFEWVVRRTTKSGLELMLRPARPADEALLKEFFYSLSDEAVYRRFLSPRRRFPHEFLQKLSVIDYTREMVMLAITEQEDSERVVGVGQYGIIEDKPIAEAGLVVRDDHRRRGIATELVKHLTYLARTQGLEAFTAEILAGNAPMLGLIQKSNFDLSTRWEQGIQFVTARFRT